MTTPQVQAKERVKALCDELGAHVVLEHAARLLDIDNFKASTGQRPSDAAIELRTALGAALDAYVLQRRDEGEEMIETLIQASDLLLGNVLSTYDKILRFVEKRDISLSQVVAAEDIDRVKDAVVERISTIAEHLRSLPSRNEADAASTSPEPRRLDS